MLFYTDLGHLSLLGPLNQACDVRCCGGEQVARGINRMGIPNFRDGTGRFRNIRVPNFRDGHGNSNLSKVRDHGKFNLPKVRDHEDKVLTRHNMVVLDLHALFIPLLRGGAGL